MIRHIKAPTVIPAQVRYSSPANGGAEYISVCLPAFSPDAAHRDEG